MRLGFIGLGNMGDAIAWRLRERGHELTVCDLRPDAAARHLTAGARWARTPREASADAEAVLLCLPGPDQVASVVLGDDGVLSGASGSCAIIDLSTTGPDTSRDLADRASQAGLRFVDAPISGGVVGARSGDLSIAVGTDARTFNDVRSLLQDVGSRVFHAGPVGSGAIAKLLNNQLCFISLLASIEALVLGVKLGIDPAVLHEYVASSSGASYSWAGGTKAILQNRLRPHFTTALACKDMGLAKNVADEGQVPTPMADSARLLLEGYRDRGYADDDLMATVRALEEIAGVRVRGRWPD